MFAVAALERKIAVKDISCLVITHLSPKRTPSLIKVAYFQKYSTMAALLWCQTCIFCSELPAVHFRSQVTTQKTHLMCVQHLFQAIAPDV